MKKVIPILLAVLALLSASRGFSQEQPPSPLPSAVPPTNAPNPPLSPDASFFYGQLAPYGQWFWTEPHGWVWTPNNVAVGWRPCTDGNWCYTDCGPVLIGVVGTRDVPIYLDGLGTVQAFNTVTLHSRVDG